MKQPSKRRRSRPGPGRERQPVPNPDDDQESTSDIPGGDAAGVTITARNVGDDDIALGEVAVVVRWSLPVDGEDRSPVVDVVKAGSGRFVPSVANPTAPILAVLHGPEGSPPPGTLMTHDMQLPQELHVENALKNLALALSFSMGQAWPPAPGKIRFADNFLGQFGVLAVVARHLIDQLPLDPWLRDTKLRARELIEDLARWATLNITLRSGGDATRELEVDHGIVSTAIELVRVSRRLRLQVQELNQQNPSAPSWLAEFENHLVRWGDLVKFLAEHGVQGLESRVQRCKHTLPRPVVTIAKQPGWYRLGEAWEAATNACRNPDRIRELHLTPALETLLREPGWRPS